MSCQCANHHHHTPHKVDRQVKSLEEVAGNCQCIAVVQKPGVVGGGIERIVYHIAHKDGKVWLWVDGVDMLCHLKRKGVEMMRYM